MPLLYPRELTWGKGILCVENMEILCTSRCPYLLPESAWRRPVSIENVGSHLSCEVLSLPTTGHTGQKPMSEENVANPLPWKVRINRTRAFTLQRGLASVANVEHLFFNVTTSLLTAQFILERILMNAVNIGKP
jgi:hypothetical protein